MKPSAVVLCENVLAFCKLNPHVDVTPERLKEFESLLDSWVKQPDLTVVETNLSAAIDAFDSAVTDN
jgi:hypothetical protein